MSARGTPAEAGAVSLVQRALGGRRLDPLVLAMAAVAVAGLAIALYLAYAKLSGGSPYCGPLRTCETVQESPYSEFMGIPVSLLGAGYMATALGLVAAWRRFGRPALFVLYGLGLAGLLVVVYLTYLELFVIEAICPWCVAFAACVVTLFVLTMLALRRRAEPERAGPG